MAPFRYFPPSPKADPPGRTSRTEHLGLWAKKGVSVIYSVSGLWFSRRMLHGDRSMLVRSRALAPKSVGLRNNDRPRRPVIVSSYANGLSMHTCLFSFSIHCNESTNFGQIAPEEFCFNSFGKWIPRFQRLVWAQANKYLTLTAHCFKCFKHLDDWFQ